MKKPQKIDTFLLPAGMSMSEKAIHNNAIDKCEKWLPDYEELVVIISKSCNITKEGLLTRNVAKAISERLRGEK